MDINKTAAKHQEVSPDSNLEETQEWCESLDSLSQESGSERASFVLHKLVKHAKRNNIDTTEINKTDYKNTIPKNLEPDYPGNISLEKRYLSWLRWNAAILVHRAQRPEIGGVGGHISTYASAAALYEVGFNHFFRGKEHPGGGDQIFFQGHSSPGIYARAFLEGRISEAQLDGFRQEKSHDSGGLPSYPHPRLMSNFWEFPTVSMGLGPLNAIYQAQSNRYLHNRGIKDTSQQQVWAFLGDGEMDEVESRGMLQTAANDKLDNLNFVIKCNLQRLDGPVRGNGSIVQELESYFLGAGWNVIKIMWDSKWDELLEKDTHGYLTDIMNSTLDGDYQTQRAKDGKFIRETFFNKYPQVRDMVAHLSDDEIWELQRGGHDYKKIHAAYKAAMDHKGQPTVILAQTLKGYGLGSSFESRNATHQMKKLTINDLKSFRDYLDIPISDAELEKNPYLPPYYIPEENSQEIQYLHERRRQLGGYVPAHTNSHSEISLPDEKVYEIAYKGSGKNLNATTMSLVRLMSALVKNKEIGKRIVPIIPDEARTFGLESLFPTAKIYNPLGQNYLPVDQDLLLSYKESAAGQILQVGINEAGALAAFTAAGTAYATHGEPLIPFYIFYSMFGFQRTADAIWAAADQMARGFLIGATAGRTTLTGEGLQHADGHSPLLASTNPAVITYDPAYSYEIGHIVRSGIERMYGKESDDRNLIYYLTVYNEPTPQPAALDQSKLDIEGILRGIYHLSSSPIEGPKSQILASGIAVQWALEAQKILAEDWGVSCDIWSVTSWSELRRDGMQAEEDTFLNPNKTPRTPFITTQLSGASGPIVAVSDYMRIVPDQIRQFVPNEFASLGTDGFGFSDTRAAARRFFKIDGPSIVVRTLQMLARRGEIDWRAPEQAIAKYRLHDIKAGKTGNHGGDD